MITDIIFKYPEFDLNYRPYVKMRELNFSLEKIFTIRNYREFKLNFDMIVDIDDVLEIKRLETLAEVIELKRLGFFSMSVYNYAIDLIENQFSKSTPSLIMDKMGCSYNGNFRVKDSFYKYRDNLWYNSKFPVFKSALSLSKKKDEVTEGILLKFDEVDDYYEEKAFYLYFIVLNILHVSKSKSYISNGIISLVNSLQKELKFSILSEEELDDLSIKDLTKLSHISDLIYSLIDSLLSYNSEEFFKSFNEVISIVS